MSQLRDTPFGLFRSDELAYRRVLDSLSHEAQGCNNAPPQHGDSRQTPTGRDRQDGSGRPGIAQTGT